MGNVRIEFSCDQTTVTVGSLPPGTIFELHGSTYILLEDASGFYGGSSDAYPCVTINPGDLPFLNGYGRNTVIERKCIKGKLLA